MITSAADFYKYVKIFNLTQGNGPTGPYLLKSANLSDASSIAACLENLGLGSGAIITITDSDLIGGTYTLNNPCPNFLTTNISSTLSPEIRLPSAQGTTAFQKYQGILIFNDNSNGQSLTVNVADGSTTVATIAPSDAFIIRLTDNSTTNGTWQAVGSILSVNGQTGEVNLTGSGSLIYVDSKNGIDGSGRGGVLAPYQSISAAMTATVPVSPNDPYIFICSGSFSETNLLFKPNMYLFGNNSSLSVENTVILDPSWSVGGVGGIFNFYNVSLPNGLLFNFDAGGENFALFQFQNLTMNSSDTYAITGKSGSSGNTTVYLDNINGLQASPTFTFIDTNTNISHCDFLNFSTTNSTNNDKECFIYDSFISGDLLAETTSTGILDFQLSSSNVEGNTNYTSTSSGQCVVTSISNLYSSPPTAAGANTNLKIDWVSVLPILTGGATVNYLPLGNGVNANFSPVNYTPVDSSVTGHLEGIDTALASLGSGSPPQLLYLDSINGNDSNDGTIGKPYLTYAAAAAAAITAGASAATPYATIPIGIFNITGDITLYPFISIIGQDTQTSQLICTGDIVFDSSWDSIANSKCIVSNCLLNASSFSLILSAAQSQMMFFVNVDYTAIPTATLTGSGLGPCLFLFKDCIYAGSSPNVTATNAYVSFVSAMAGNVTSIGNSASAGANLTFYNSQNPGALYIQSTGSGTSNLGAFATLVNSGLTLDGAGVTAQFDSTSYGSIPTFMNGASFSSITLSSLSDGTSQTTFSPSNYTPVGSSSWPANSVTGNFAGIDAALADSGDGQINITDNSSVSASVYPVWVGGNSGLQPAFVSSAKWTWNPGTGFQQFPALNLGETGLALSNPVNFNYVGIDGTISGPHFQAYTDADTNYPVLQNLNWTHDNISFSFDAFFDGEDWISSYATSNHQIAKYADDLQFKFSSGNSPGDVFDWNVALFITNAGQLNLPLLSPDQPLSLDSSNNIINTPLQYAQMYTTNNTRATTFSSSSFIQIEAGNPLNPTPDYSGYVSDIAQNFVFSGGTLQFVGSSSKKFLITCNMTVLLSTGVNVLFGFALGKNGSAISNSQSELILNTLVGGNPQIVNTQCSIILNPNDTVAVYASNVSNTGDKFVAKFINFSIS